MRVPFARLPLSPVWMQLMTSVKSMATSFPTVMLAITCQVVVFCADGQRQQTPAVESSQR